jgi:hypothetical protein
MSVAWNVMASSDLNDYQVAAMMTALRESALADGQADPFTAIMHDRANYIRNRISKKIQISATAYAIPPELKTCACWLIIEAMQTRLPGLSLSEDQKSQISRAYKDLDIAATVDLPISDPTDPVTPAVSSGQGFEQVSTPTRKTSRTKLDGL